MCSIFCHLSRVYQYPSLAILVCTIVGGGLDCDTKASIVVLSFFVFGCGIVAEAFSLQNMLIILQTELHCSEWCGVNGVGAVLQ